jgi:hypothetical protein
MTTRDEQRRVLDSATLDQLGAELSRRVEREMAADPEKGRALALRILSRMKESLDEVGYPIPENMIELMAALESDRKAPVLKVVG